MKKKEYLRIFGVLLENPNGEDEMTRNELIELIEMHIEDSASVAEFQNLDNVATALNRLAYAASARAAAVRCRLNGDIKQARIEEDKAEWGIEKARVALVDRDAAL